MFLRDETFHQILTVMTVSLNQVHFGIGDGWMAPTLQKLQQQQQQQQQPNSTLEIQLYLTTEDCSWIASVEHIGKILGCLVAASLLDILGRKLLLTGCALTYFFVWLGVTFADSVWIICAARFCFGIARGTNNGIDSVYVAEVTSSATRGIFGALLLTLYHFGMLAEYVAATYVPYRVTAALNAALGFVTVFSVFWMVESVQFLLLRGRESQARKNFLWLRATTTLDSATEGEFHAIRQNVQLEKGKKQSVREVLTSPVNRKALAIVVLVYSLADATGYAGILSFSSMIFASTELLTENDFTILLGFSQFVMALFSAVLINRYDRRTLLLVGFSLITVNQLCTAILYYVHERLSPVPAFPWLGFLSVTLFFAITTLVYPAVFAVRGELLPLSVKAVGGSVVVIGNSLTNFAVNKSFLYVSTRLGVHVNFILYAVAGLVFVLFIYFCLPETRNKSLTDIQKDLHKEDDPESAKQG